MSDDQIKLNEFRDKEIQDRLTRLADGWGGYDLNYIYDELIEIADIVWEMIYEGDDD